MKTEKTIPQRPAKMTERKQTTRAPASKANQLTPKEAANAKAAHLAKYTREQIALTKAVDIIGNGNNTAAAKKLGISHSTLWTWRNRNKQAPAEICRRIEALTEIQVTRYDLRPDVYGENHIDLLTSKNLTPEQRIIAMHLLTIETQDPDIISSTLQTLFGYNAKEAAEHYQAIKREGLL